MEDACQGMLDTNCSLDRKTASFVDLCKRASEGTTNRVRLSEDRFKTLEIALPPRGEQRRIVAHIEELAAMIREAQGL